MCGNLFAAACLHDCTPRLRSCVRLPSCPLLRDGEWEAQSDGPQSRSGRVRPHKVMSEKDQLCFLVRGLRICAAGFTDGFRRRVLGRVCGNLFAAACLHDCTPRLRSCVRLPSCPLLRDGEWEAQSDGPQSRSGRVRPHKCCSAKKFYATLWQFVSASTGL